MKMPQRIPIPRPIPEDSELYDQVLQAITPSVPVGIHKHFNLLSSMVRSIEYTENKFDITCDDLLDFTKRIFNLENSKYLSYENIEQALRLTERRDFVFSKLPNYEKQYKPLLKRISDDGKITVTSEENDKDDTEEESETTSEDSGVSGSSTPVNLPVKGKGKRHSMLANDHTSQLIKSALEKFETNGISSHVGRRRERSDSEKEARPIGSRGRAADKEGKAMYAVHPGTPTPSRGRGRGRPQRVTPYPQRDLPGKPGKKAKNLRSMS